MDRPDNPELESVKRAIFPPFCIAVTRTGVKCPYPTVPKSRYCTLHKAVLEPARNKVGHGLYASKMNQKVQKLYEALLTDKELFSIHHELAIFKAHMAHYLDMCEQQNLMPDPKTLALFLETMRRCVETQHGKKYQLTVQGVVAVVENITAILADNLEDQPEVMLRIVRQMRALAVEPDQVEGMATIRQLQEAHPEAEIIDDRKGKNAPRQV